MLGQSFTLGIVKRIDLFSPDIALGAPPPLDATILSMPSVVEHAHCGAVSHEMFENDGKNETNGAAARDEHAKRAVSRVALEEASARGRAKAARPDELVFRCGRGFRRRAGAQRACHSLGNCAVAMIESFDAETAALPEMPCWPSPQLPFPLCPTT